MQEVELFTLHEDLLQGQHAITELQPPVRIDQGIQRTFPQQDLATAAQHQQQVDAETAHVLDGLDGNLAQGGTGLHHVERIGGLAHQGVLDGTCGMACSLAGLGSLA